MSQRILRLDTIGTGEITFADPSSIVNTSKFTHKNSQRSTDLGLVPHTRAEYISNRNAIRMVGETKVQEALSVRIKISGAQELAVQQKQHVLDSLENFRRAVEGGILDGFLPRHTDEFVIDFGL